MLRGGVERVGVVRGERGHHAGFRLRPAGAWPSSLPLYLGPGAPGEAGGGAERRPGGEEFEGRHVPGRAWSRRRVGARA